MNKTNVKPLSVNEAWQGRRFKTQAYKNYEHELYFSLPNKINIPSGKIGLFLRFGLSSKNADWDNPVKPFQDVLQKKYGFNDKNVYKATVEKVIVPKGEEFIEWEITSLSTD